MKKLVLSVGVIMVFGLYSLLGQKNQTTQLALPLPNSQPKTDTSTTAAQTGLLSAVTSTPATSNPPSSGSSNTPSTDASGSTGATAPSSSTSTTTTPSSGQYKNGNYTGSAYDAYYGSVQVKAVITNGQLSDVQFLQWPNDRRTSQNINNRATVALRQEAIQAQSAYVNIVSGATDTSQAFMQSLSSALAQAQV